MTVTIGRRELLAALGGAAAWPLTARAQQPPLPARWNGALSFRNASDEMRGPNWRTSCPRRGREVELKKAPGVPGLPVA